MLVRRRQRRLALASLLLAALAPGCGEPRYAPKQKEELGSSRVDVFVRPRASGATLVSMELAAVEIRGASEEVAVLELSRTLVSSQSADQRLAIAGATVPPGTYDTLAITVRAAWLGPEGARSDLRLRDPLLADESVPTQFDEDRRAVVYEIPVQVRIDRRDAVSIFLDWDADSSVVGGAALLPRFSVALETPVARLALLYVADRATGSVLALNRISGEVVGTIKVGRGPTGLALSRDRRTLYVANSGEGSLSVVDLIQNFTAFTIPVRMGAETFDSAVVDGIGVVAATNPGINTVTLFDQRTSEKLDDIAVGQVPRRMVAIPELRRLYTINYRSENMTVIDAFARRAVGVVPLRAEPTDLAVNFRHTEIYVGHRISTDLVVVDALSLAELDSIYVGDSVTAVLGDRRRARAYVARSHPPEVVVVDRGIGSIIRRIPVAGTIVALVQPSTGATVFGAAPELGGVIAINVVRGREETFLPCGSAPADLAVVE